MHSRRSTGQLGLRKTTCIVFVFCIAAVVVSPAQTFTTLVRFDGSDGNGPAGVVQGTDGNFYGTTSPGGADDAGEIFKIDPAGKLIRLYSFCYCADGYFDVAGVVLGTDGNFYGTTVYGGTNNLGTVFKITPDGNLTTLHSFDGSDGEFPNGGLLQGSEGAFYGTMPHGGANGEGTVFKITSAGTLTTLHSFNGTDGAFPFAGVIQANDGSFYGTTAQDGPLMAVEQSSG
jgi:uncharacterized repeat protein (TIGR03803 family)